MKANKAIFIAKWIVLSDRYSLNGMSFGAKSKCTSLTTLHGTKIFVCLMEVLT